jgi:putative ABC transport system substrate-binding protein
VSAIDVGAVKASHDSEELGGAAAWWPLAARAQQTKLWRIGLLSGVTRPNSIGTSSFGGFLQGMRHLGYVEGRNFVIEWRFADGKYDRFQEFAAEFVRLKVDVIMVAASVAVPSVQHVTTTIPIVMGYSIDPVGNGLVASLARPGGNTTGLASAQEDQPAASLLTHFSSGKTMTSKRSFDTFAVC